MTPADRGRMAQIAAYGIESGEPIASIEARLASYTSGIQPDEIASALAAGRRAVDTARAIQAGDIDTADANLAEMEASGAPFVRAMARFRIGPGDDDWRTVAPYLPAGALVGEIVREVKQQVEHLTRNKYRANLAFAFTSIEYQFVAPA